MGLNIKRKVLISETTVKRCEACNEVFQNEHSYCTHCGKKLISEKTKVYANIGKKGITSYSYKLPNGTTINSKGNVTVPITRGISFTLPKKK